MLKLRNDALRHRGNGANLMLHEINHAVSRAQTRINPRSYKLLLSLLLIALGLVSMYYYWLPSIDAKKPNILIISFLLKYTGTSLSNGAAAPLVTKNSFKLSTTDPLLDLTMVDIGVYDGGEAAKAVDKGFTVYAFEPINSHIGNIRRTFAENGLQDKMKVINLTKIYEDANSNVDAVKEYLIKTKQEWIPQMDGFMYLFQAAASNEYGVSEMKDAGVWSSMNTNNVPGNQSNSPVSTVITVPISDIVERDIMWFKSDTQGFETLALKGAIDLFQNYKVDHLWIEFWPWAIIKNFGENGIQNLLLLLQNELNRKVCYPTRPDLAEWPVSARPLNIYEFEHSYKMVYKSLHFGVFEDLLCV